MSEIYYTDEPDQDSGEHAGLHWVMIRHPDMGHWCGYVGVPESHPFHDKSYNELYYLAEDPDINVHGGLTFSGKLRPEFAKEGLHYFGFDCNHLGDIAPLMGWGIRDPSSVYRDYNYVKAECLSLAEQLAKQNETL